MALALEAFDPASGGAERYAWDLARRLTASGHEVDVLARRWAEGAPASRLVRLRAPGWPAWLRLIAFAAAHRRVVRAGEYDVVLGFGNTLEMNVFQSHGGVHDLWLERDLASYQNSLGRAARRLARWVSLKHRAGRWIEGAPWRAFPRPLVVAISRMVATDFARLLGARPEEVVLVHNGVDTARFHPDNRARWREEVRRQLGLGDAYVLLFVAGNPRLKGIGPLAAAAAHLAGRGLDFRVVTAGRSCRELLRGCAAADRFVWAGHTGAPERLYAAADVLVHPTFYDACSLVVLEALAAGLPAITTAHNGAAGAITDGVEGYVLADARDVEGLADRIERLADQSRRAGMAQAARRRALELDHGRSLGRMVEVLEEVARTRSPRLVRLAIEAHRETMASDAPGVVKRDAGASASLVAAGGQELFVKEFVRGGPSGCLRRWLGRSPARRAWNGARILVEAGIATPEPLGIVEEGRRGFVVFRRAEGTEVDRFALQEFGEASSRGRGTRCFATGRPEPPPLDKSARRRRFVVELAHALRRLHDAGVQHRDLKTCNIFASRRGDGFAFAFCDTDSVRRAPGGVGRRLARTLAELGGSAPRLFTRADRLRFLLAYAGQEGLDDDLRRLARRVLQLCRGRPILYVGPDGDVMEERGW